MVALVQKYTFVVNQCPTVLPPGVVAWELLQGRPVFPSDRTPVSATPSSTPNAPGDADSISTVTMTASDSPSVAISETFSAIKGGSQNYETPSYESVASTDSSSSSDTDTADDGDGPPPLDTQFPELLDTLRSDGAFRKKLREAILAPSSESDDSAGTDTTTSDDSDDDSPGDALRSKLRVPVHVSATRKLLTMLENPTG